MPLAWSQQQVYLLARDGRLWDFRAQQDQPLSQDQLLLQQLLGRRDPRRPGARAGRQAGSHRHRPLPGGASPGQGGLGPALRGAVSLVRPLLQPARPARSRARVSAGGRSSGPRREDFLRYAASEGSQVRGGRAGLLLADRAIASRSTTRAPAPRAAAPGSRTKPRSSTKPRTRWPSTPASTTALPHAALAGRGLGHDVRSARRVGLAELSAAERPHQSRSAGPVSPMAARRAAQPGAFVNLLGSDRQFETNPSAAYAEAWAWVFFLTETYPQKFGRVRAAGRQPARLSRTIRSPAHVGFHDRLWRRPADAGKALPAVHRRAAVGTSRARRAARASLPSSALALSVARAAAC